MAKLVLAGAANCPYYAKCELLADSLVKNLPNFQLHKIVIQPNKWETWLTETCQNKGWKHAKSPLVWRELVDRGGKGTFIGGANEFQEYANGYYGQKSKFTSDDMTKIASENLQTKDEIDEEERYLKSQSKPVRVCITNASSDVCYGMLHAIASGDVLGQNTEVDLHLYDTDDKLSYLEGLALEATDLSCNLLREVSLTSNIYQAFTDCDAIVLLDEIEQAADESKDSWYKRNHVHFTNFAKIINEVASKEVKVIVAGNGPVNFIAQMMLEMAPEIKRYNIIAMSRMVENRAKAALADRLKVNSAGVVDVIIWGNPVGVSYTDVSKSRVHGYEGAIWGPPSFSLSVTEMVHDDKWLAGEFLDLVKQRKELVEGSLRHKATMSHAAACATLLGHWWNGSPEGQMFSVGVCSKGWYGVPDGVVFSYPVIFSTPGFWSVVQDVDVTDEDKENIQNCVKDLESEKEIIYPPPYVPPPTPQEPEPEAQLTSEEKSAEESGGEVATDSQPDSDKEGTSGSTTETDTEDKPSLAKITEEKEEESTEDGGRVFGADANKEPEA